MGISDQNAKIDVLKQTFKEINIGHQIVLHIINLAGSKSIVKTGNKQHQYTKNFVSSRF